MEQKRKLVRQNSSIAPHSAYEHQTDVCLWGVSKQKCNVGMILIDVFDKFKHVVPIMGKREEDSASGVLWNWLNQKKGNYC